MKRLLGGSMTLVAQTLSACRDATAPTAVASPEAPRFARSSSTTTSSDARASYSNFGSRLDLFAPGSSITSAWYTPNTATSTISGTSMAAPHVAGAAALVLQGTPAASPSTVTSAIVNAATTGTVTSPGSGSPNRLLFTGPTSGGDTGGGTEQTPTVLSVRMSKSGPNNVANLSWTGGTSPYDVFRFGTRVTTVSGTTCAQNLGRNKGTSTNRVRDSGTTFCSSDVTVFY
jgi:subtilisin family serine protease